MKMSALRLLPGLLLGLCVGCSADESPPPHHQPSVRSSIDDRVKIIQTEAEYIDRTTGARADPETHQLTAEVPHWQFSGYFETSTPILLNALFTEGELVREETYYLKNAEPRLVQLARWWDVDEEEYAPEPATGQDFYIEGDQIIRQVTNVQASPPHTQTDDSLRSAAKLAARSRAIAQILVGSHDAALIESLEVFPDEESSRP